MTEDVEVQRLLCAIFPTRFERVLTWVIDWGYDSKRFEGMTEAEIIDSDMPDTTGLRAWIGDRCDDIRAWSWHRRAAKLSG